MGDLIGQQLGQYQIVALLGKGGMATVYRAKQISIGREVAIKVIKPTLLEIDEFVTRFNREAHTIAALSHPHILKIFDYSQHEDIVYLVMELLTGGSLAQLLQEGPLALDYAARLFDQIASALDYAHEMGVIHRDLKPENVLLDAKGNAFLTDFGIARLIQDDTTALTQSGAMMGTPAYMSPEQWRGEVIDSRADIYALGVMLFEMLSGNLPFKADTPYGLMYAHVNLQPPLLHQIHPELPNLQHVIGKALVKNRDERYSTAAALGSALKQALFTSSTSMPVEIMAGNRDSAKRDDPTMMLGVKLESGNPFFNRGAIRDRAYFVNREYEIRQVLTLLKNGQSVSLIGQRRIGKTSLMFHIASPEIFTQHGLTQDEYVFVYIDCGSLADLDQSEIYRILLEEISDAKDLGNLEALQSSTPVTYRVLERSLRSLLGRHQKLILLLDEFELMSQNPALDPDFFSGLRALATRHAVAFVTASKQPLLALTYANSSTLSSPFFNIFAAIRLTLFSEEAANKLITQLAALAGIAFAEPVISAILALGGTQPLFLQIASYEAFELQQAKGDSLTEDDFLDLEQRFLSAVEQHFAYYWRSLTAVEQQVLISLPAAQNSDLETLRSLEQYSLIVRRKEGYAYLSAAFRAYVQAQPVPGLIQAGLLVIDERKRRVLLKGEVLTLSELQYHLLGYLAARTGEVVTNEELERAIWGDEYVEDAERLKSVIKGLRRVLGDEATYLENVRGVGYMWRIAS